MAEQDPDTAADPRARWRRLPPEPAQWIAETAVEPTSASYTVPNVDPAKDFIRRYGG